MHCFEVFSEASIVGAGNSQATFYLYASNLCFFQSQYARPMFTIPKEQNAWLKVAPPDRPSTSFHFCNTVHSRCGESYNIGANHKQS